METSRPYKAIPSPSATKISALPKALGSSEVAPIAAGGAAATAIPPPAMPVDRAAAIRPIPLAELAAAAAVEASAAWATIGTPKQNRVTTKKETS